MTEPSRQSLSVNGAELNVYHFAGPGSVEAGPDPAPMVMVHGMRDVALSLLPQAQAVARTRPVYLMDLRGHGRSAQPGGYAMPQFVFDLEQVLTELVGRSAVLFGHSLGGHLVCRVAALFPTLVEAAIVVEGLGPPDGRQPEDPAEAMAMEAERLKGTLSIPARQRPLPDLAFAAGRLLANNPRLDPDRALELARHGTVTNAAGELNWAFDPRVQSVFIGSEGDSDRYWSLVRCPTLIVAGTHAGDYWRRAMTADGDWSGDFAPGELEARVASFPDAELALFDGSGHMVHFDEPERLSAATLDFLRRRL
ncbi:MAG: alpha/beta hydrolase [Pseudomonadota bacterium]